jgi:hypothetical protein
MSSAKSRSSSISDKVQLIPVFLFLVVSLITQSIQKVKRRGESRYICLTPVFNLNSSDKFDPQILNSGTEVWIEHLYDGDEFIRDYKDSPKGLADYTVESFGEINVVDIKWWVPFIALFHYLSESEYLVCTWSTLSLSKG